MLLKGHVRGSNGALNLESELPTSSTQALVRLSTPARREAHGQDVTCQGTGGSCAGTKAEGMLVWACWCGGGQEGSTLIG